MNLELSLDSVETAHRFVALLGEAVAESKRDIEADVKREADGNFPRRRDAVQIVLTKLVELDALLTRSRRTLNDLRSLRRLMLEEREVPAVKPKALPLDKVPTSISSNKRRAVSARVEKPTACVQIAPWYLRPDLKPGSTKAPFVRSHAAAGVGER